MPVNSNIATLLSEISRKRKEQHITEDDLENHLLLGKGWIKAFEKGDINPSLDLILAVTNYLKIDFNSLIVNIDFDDIQSLDRKITVLQDEHNIKCLFKYGRFEAEYLIKNSSIKNFEEIISEFRQNINNKKVRKTKAVSNCFFKAIQLFPQVNPSDMWYFIVSRIYQDPYNHPVESIDTSFEQSWKRTAGWALEEIFVEYYKDELKKHNIEIGIFKKKTIKKLLDSMSLNKPGQTNKADVLLINTKNNLYECFGVVHVKSSFAERRNNDQSFSEALLRKNYFSPFMTLDCKASPSKNPINRGELGEILNVEEDKRSEKRKEFEEENLFSACFSFNQNTKPTPSSQRATSRIYTMTFQNPNDEFIRMTVDARNRLWK